MFRRRHYGVKGFMKKKIVAIVLLIALILSVSVGLTACKPSGDDGGGTTTPTDPINKYPVSAILSDALKRISSNDLSMLIQQSVRVNEQQEFSLFDEVYYVFDGDKNARDKYRWHTWEPFNNVPSTRAYEVRFTRADGIYRGSPSSYAPSTPSALDMVGKQSQFNFSKRAPDIMEEDTGIMVIQDYLRFILSAVTSLVVQQEDITPVKGGGYEIAKTMDLRDIIAALAYTEEKTSTGVMRPVSSLVWLDGIFAAAGLANVTVDSIFSVLKIMLHDDTTVDSFITQLLAFARGFSAELTKDDIVAFIVTLAQQKNSTDIYESLAESLPISISPPKLVNGRLESQKAYMARIIEENKDYKVMDMVFAFTGIASVEDLFTMLVSLVEGMPPMALISFAMSGSFYLIEPFMTFLKLIDQYTSETEMSIYVDIDKDGYATAAGFLIDVSFEARGVDFEGGYGNILPEDFLSILEFLQIYERAQYKCDVVMDKYNEGASFVVPPDFA